MLVETAIGDAYGAGFEYCNPDRIRRHNDLSKYLQHPKHLGIKPGMYTDDTQMSIAIAEVILSKQEWTPENLAESFVRCFKRDQRAGYAGRVYEFLLSIKDGRDFLSKILPHSDKSGAAMRAGSIGIFRNIDDIIEKATIQAKITHNTPDGIKAAVAAALMPHYFIYNLGSKSDLARFIETNVEGDWSAWEGKVGAKGVMSVRAAITAIIRNNKLSELLKSSIDFSGDVDTVAAIALGAASCSKEYEKDLPENLYRNLEDEKYGINYLTELDQKLMSLKNNL